MCAVATWHADTDLLDPSCRVDRIDAVCLAAARRTAYRRPMA